MRAIQKAPSPSQVMGNRNVSVPLFLVIAAGSGSYKQSIV